MNVLWLPSTILFYFSFIKPFIKPNLQFNHLKHQNWERVSLFCEFTHLIFIVLFLVILKTCRKVVLNKMQIRPFFSLFNLRTTHKIGLKQTLQSIQEIMNGCSLGDICKTLSDKRISFGSIQQIWLLLKKFNCEAIMLIH